MADAQQNILINFQSDGDGLQPGIDGLNALAVKDKALADQSAVTMAAVDARNKSIVAGTATAVTSNEKLATSFGNLNKSLAGGAFASAMKDISAATKDTQAQLATAKTSYDNLGTTAAALTAKHVSLRTAVLNAKYALADVIATTGTSGPAFDAAKNKVALLENEMLHLNEITKVVGSDTPGLKGLIGIASGVAAAFSVVNGVTALLGDNDKDLQEALLKVNGAMAILQGLTELQVTLEKSSAASMLITTLFTKEKTVAVVEATVAEEAETVALGEQTVALEATAGAAETMAGAEEALAVSTELALGPIGILLGVLAAAGAAYAYVANNAKKAEEATLLANDEIYYSTELLQSGFDGLDDAIKKQTSDLNLQGATRQQLLKEDAMGVQQKIDGYNKEITELGKTLNSEVFLRTATAESINKLTDEQYKLEIDRDKLTTDLYVKKNQLLRDNYEDDLKSYTAYQDSKVALAAKGSADEITAQINAINAHTTDAINLRLHPDLTPGEIANIVAEANKKIIQLDNDLLLLQLNNQKELYQAKLATIQKGSVAELQEQQKISDQEYLIQISTLGKSEEARQALRAQQAQSDLQFQQQIIVRATQLQQDLSKAKLAIASKGSADEFAAQLSIAVEQRTIDLNAEGVTAEKKVEINAEYLKSVRELYLKEQENEVSDQLKFLNAGLAAFGLNEAQKLQLTIQRINAERNLQLLQAQNSDGTTDPAAAAEINAKADEQILNSRLATNKAVLDSSIATADAYSANWIAQNKRVIDSDVSTAQAKIAAYQNIQAQQDLIFKLQSDTLADNLKEGLITQADYNLQYQLLLNKHQAETQTNADAELKIQEEHTAKLHAALQKSTDDLVSFYQTGVDAVLGTSATEQALNKLAALSASIVAITQNTADQIAKINASSASQADKDAAISKVRTKEQLQEAVQAVQATQAVLNQVFADAEANRQTELNNEIQTLENSKAKELAVANLTAQQIADINERYAQKEARLKLAAFNADKKAKEEQAEINGALAITLAFATYPFYVALGVAAVIAATTAIEVNDIAQTQAPAFRDGVIDLKGPGTATSDSINAKLSAGESVMTAKETANHKDVLLAIRNGMFNEKFAKIPNRMPAKMPDMFKGFIYPKLPADAKDLVRNSQGIIDYEKLGDSIAQKMAATMPEPFQLHNVLDKDGIHTFVTRGKNKTEYKNARYSMKGGRNK